MIRRAVFLADGPSDEPLGDHLEAMCAERGSPIRITTPDLRRLPRPPGLKVEDRLRAVFEMGNNYEIIFVHRDAEKQIPRDRYSEVEAAVHRVRPALPWVAVVPVRMTEAWLLLDEREIRQVAGRPRGTNSLALPAPNRVEREPNPKLILQGALEQASGLKGRKMKQFKRRFGEHRRLLVARMDIHGPVRRLEAWKALEGSVDRALAQLPESI